MAADYAALSRRAADWLVAELRQRPALLLCAAAGDTPTGTYAQLAARRRRQPSLFRKMRVLQLDEWSGLSADCPASCAADLQTKLLMPLGIGPARFTGFRGAAPDAERECARVARWLAANGPMDVCVLGLGRNGHVGMNEPADAVKPQAHVARLAPGSRRHPMLAALPRPPRYGLTLGLGEILRARRILMLVSGGHKRAALHRLGTGRVTARFPASFLHLHPDVTVLCDRAAAGLPGEALAKQNCNSGNSRRARSGIGDDSGRNAHAFRSFA